MIHCSEWWADHGSMCADHKERATGTGTGTGSLLHYGLRKLSWQNNKSSDTVWLQITQPKNRKMIEMKRPRWWTQHGSLQHLCALSYLTPVVGPDISGMLSLFCIILDQWSATDRGLEWKERLSHRKQWMAEHPARAGLCIDVAA